MARRLFVLALLAAPALAQGDGVGNPYWVLTPPAAATALDEALQSVHAQEWTSVARALQTVFDRYETTFVASTRPGYYEGARKRAIQLLVTMPAKVREAYQELYGLRAEEALRQSLAKHDRAGLISVVRRFEATEAGRDALLALADSATSSGHPAEARLLLARLTSVHPATRSDPAVRKRVRLAAARDFAQGGPPPPRTAGSGEGPPTRRRMVGSDWGMLGGNEERNREASEPSVHALRHFVNLDIEERRWDRPEMRQRRGGGSTTSTYKFDLSWSMYLPLQPVIARGLLIHQDGREVSALNLYTNDTEWKFHAGMLEEDGRTNLGTLFSPVAVDGVVYTALEVQVPFTSQTLNSTPITYYIPGRRLFALDLETGKPIWSHDDTSLRTHPQGEMLRKLTITGVPLVRGDRIYAGACYSAGTFHNFLVAVDRHSGELLYATRISNGQQELNLFGRQLQECVPTPVAEKDGVLYYGTNLGIVAAIDALLGTPIWATGYDVETIPSTYFWYEAPRRWPTFQNGPPIIAGDLLVIAPTDSTELMAINRKSGAIRWKLRHRSKRLGFKVRRMYGADDERVYVGGQMVAALWLRNGEDHRAGDIAWIQDVFEDDELALGSGLMTRGSEGPEGPGLWVPTDTCLYRFDRRTGNVTRSIDREEADAGQPVNMLWGAGALVLSGRDLIGIRFDAAEVNKRVHRMVLAAPQSPQPLLTAADLYLAQRKVQKAIELYGRARRRARALDNEAVTRRALSGLHRAYMLRVRMELDDPDGIRRAMESFEVAIKGAPSPEKELAARFWLDERLAMRHRRDEANARLKNLKAIASGFGGRALDERGGTIRGWTRMQRAQIQLELEAPRRALDELHLILRDEPGTEDARRATTSVQTILAKSGRAVYASFERLAERLFEGAFRSGDLAAVTRGIALYPNARATSRAILQLARRHLASSRPGDTVAVLQQFLLRHGDSTHVPDALFLRARALHTQRSFSSAFSTFRLLKERYGERLVKDGEGVRRTARDLAESWLQREPYPTLALSARRHDLEPPLVETFRNSFSNLDNVWAPRLAGVRPAALKSTILLRANRRLLAVESATGKVIYKIAFGKHPPLDRIVIAGNRIFAVTRHEVFLFDARDGRTLRQREFKKSVYGLALIEHEGQVFLLTRRGKRQGDYHVSALDPADAKDIWTTPLPTSPDSLIESESTLATGTRILLFANRPAQMIVVNSATGLVERTIPLRADKNAELDNQQAPRLLPDGRVLVPLSSSQRGPWREFVPTSAFALVDPAKEPDNAVLWTYQHRRENPRGGQGTFHVIGDHVVLVDDAFSAVVLDLRDGQLVRRAELRPHPNAFAGQTRLADSPEHDSLLLLLTQGHEGQPAHLAAFEIPDLKRRYSVRVGEADSDHAETVESQGVLAISLDSRTGTPRGRVRLYDPLTGRMLQEIPLHGVGRQWFSAKVQNGLLLVTSKGTTWAYGPK